MTEPPPTMELDITWDVAKAQSNLSKHGVSFTQAASVLLDPLALTVFDTAHSEQEERWFTIGQALGGTLLAIAHTYQTTGPATATVRLISARTATRHEREQYQNELR
ncbi:MAG: BrnT family toxin [Pseudomarimonas sp.]